MLTRRLVDGAVFSTAATWPLVFSDGPSESGRSARGGDFRSPLSSAGSSRENERLFIAIMCGFAQYTATLIETILIQIIGAASV